MRYLNRKGADAHFVGMPSRYEIIDHTADIAIKARGKDIEEAFANAAFAMFDTMADAQSVKPVGEVIIKAKADDLEQLLVDWLSELLFLCDSESILFSDFEVTIKGTELMGKARGEPMDPERHGLNTHIKAVTYHMLEVDEVNNTVQVLFDI